MAEQASLSEAEVIPFDSQRRASCELHTGARIEKHERGIGGLAVKGGGGGAVVVSVGVTTQSCPIPIHLTLMAKQHSDCSWRATVLTENASGEQTARCSRGALRYVDVR